MKTFQVANHDITLSSGLELSVDFEFYTRGEYDFSENEKDVFIMALYVKDKKDLHLLAKNDSLEKTARHYLIQDYDFDKEIERQEVEDCE